MNEKKRRQMFANAGLAPAIPDLSTRRTWEHIDDRTMPEGEPDGSFRSFNTWVSKAASWIGWTGARCYDTQGRPCRTGEDMMRARDEDAFPVVWYMPDRFPPPTVPDIRTMRVRDAVMRAGAVGILASEMRLRDGMRNIGPKRIADALAGRASEKDGRWTMTEQGIRDTRYEIDQANRARTVR